MTRKELIDYCLTYPDAVLDYPFGEDDNAVIRHGGNRKWLALVFEQNGELCINLKCEPLEADFLRSVYKSVIPGWHMNKVHWNTIVLGGDVEECQLFEMIDRSYKLTMGGAAKNKKKSS